MRIRNYTTQVYDSRTGADIPHPTDVKQPKFILWNSAVKFVDETNRALSKGFLPYRVRVEMVR